MYTSYKVKNEKFAVLPKKVKLITVRVSVMFINDNNFLILKQYTFFTLTL